MDDPKSAEQAIKDEIKEFRKLQSISNSEEFKDYFNFLKDTVAQKMLWAFTTGKDGDNIKNWDDFCKVRGEIIARLQPIQEVFGADAMINYLNQELDKYYTKKL